MIQGNLIAFNPDINYTRKSTFLANITFNNFLADYNGLNY
jgi:hypothetical protein